MQWHIHKNPLGLLEVSMKKGESIIAEGKAFVFMQGDVEIKTTTGIKEQGFFNRIKSNLLGKVPLFLNYYIAKDNCTIGFSGRALGDIESIEIDGSYLIQGGSYIASTEDIIMDTKFQGFTKGILGTELFMLKMQGKGIVFINAYGGIIRKELRSNEKMLIDNYHLVAINDNANYKVVKIGSWKTFALGGEGFGIELNGPATVYIQSKSTREIKEEFTKLLELDKLYKGSSIIPPGKEGRSDEQSWFTPKY